MPDKKLLAATALNIQLLTDEQLMLDYSQGHAGAFDELYRRHKDAIFRFFLRHNIPPTAAEELCHDCWLKIIKQRSLYRDEALFSTWLYTIATNTAIDFFRKQKNRQQTTIDSVDNDLNIDQRADDASPHKTTYSFENQQLQQALFEEISALPLTQRQVFLLKTDAGFSLEDIAYITNEHKEKVKSTWRYAIQKLRKGLKNHVR